MNIIYARMPGYDWVSTPSDAVARELERLGHKLTLVENMEYIPPGDYDFVWSPYESVTILGHMVSKKLGIPHFAHIEWLPPWRAIEDADPREYGYTGNEPEFQQKAQMVQHYKKVGQFWSEAAVSTLGGKAFVPYHRKIAGDVDPIIRYPSVDVKAFEMAKRMYSPKKVPNRVITVSRIVPNKRYDLMVEAMNKVTTPVEWVVVGDGDKTIVEKALNNKNVDLKMVDAMWGWARIYEMMQASVYLGAWSGMPPIEAALLDAYPLLVKTPPTKEIPEDVIDELFMGHIFKDTPENVAAKIDSLASNNDSDTPAHILDAFTNGRMGVKSAQENAFDLIMIAEAKI